jgi:rhodanese-related sulfurtransferase
MPHSARFQKLAEQAKANVREVTPAEALKQQQQGALLVDVREAEEFAKAHAPGAKHLSRGTLELKIEEAAPDLAAPIVCYCGGGSRSALAAESLQRMGYTNVASMSSGFRGWKDQGLPVEEK